MLKLFRTDIKMLLRNRQSLFWAVMMPVMFTLIFGLFFGRSNSMAGSIDFVNNSNTTVAQNLEKSLKDANVFSIKDSTDLNASKDQVEKSKISAVVYIPENFGSLDPAAPKNIQIFYDPASTQASSILSSFMDKYLNGASNSIQQTQSLFSIEQSQVGSGKAFSYFAFVLAGILGLALMNGSIIGIAVGISRYKEDKILKRLTTTPLPSWKFIVAEVASRLVLNLFQVALILFLGIKVFHADFNGNLGVLVAVALFGGLLFQLVGFVLASFAKTADAAQGMAQAIAIPMMFLSGVFFPIDALPKWLSSIVQYLPLAPLLRMLRAVAIDGNSPFANPSNSLIVLAWIVIMAGVALWKFRMNEE